MILSGLTERDRDRNRDGVPFLQDIPLLQYMFSRRDTLDLEDFQALITPPSGTAQAGAPARLSPIALGGNHVPEPGEPLPVLTLVGDNGQMKRMDQTEAEIIRFAISYYGGHMSEVARRLGIGRSTLYRKMQELKISDARTSAA